MVAGRAELAVLAAVAAVVALAGCGGSDEEGGSTRAEVAGVGIVRAGSTAQFANCRSWRRGTVEERYATIEDIRGQLTPQTAETAESDLSDKAAYQLFQHVCANEFAADIRLYKLYARAQAFAPLSAEP
jgi:hypothetical protein